jgi:hypothetical protein
MKREYAKLFEGLNNDKIAAKKEALCIGLHEKRGAHDFEQAEEGRRGAIMVRNTNTIKKQASKVSIIHIWLLKSFAGLAFAHFLKHCSNSISG